MMLSERHLPLLIVTEGANDVFFLRAVSAMLHEIHPDLPNLAHLESKHVILFLPACGSNCRDQVLRVATLNKRILCLLDREVEPETSERRKVVEQIQQSPGCAALLTKKRSLENYLHPTAILTACGIELAFTDDDDVPLLLARKLVENVLWSHLSPKGQKRARERAKKLLNLKAVQHMTPDLLDDSDPHHEVIGWLRTINKLLIQP